MSEANQKRKEQIEILLDMKLAQVPTGNMVDEYYQKRDIHNLSQALLNITRVIKEEG